MKCNVVKIAPAHFTGTDGKPVNGTYFYLRDMFGGNVRRIFLTADAVLRLSHCPEVGDSVYLVENAAGKIVDMIEDFDV